MNLEPFDYVNGVLAIIISAISIIVGIKIILKYFKYKKNTFIYVGISWIIIVESWIAVSMSFLLHVFIGIGFTSEIHALVGYIFYPLGLFLWIYAFTILYSIQMKKIIVTFFFIIELLFTIFFIYFVVTDISLIGQLNGAIDFNYGIFLILFVISALIPFCITGILFGLKGLKSDNLEIKLKGKLLILAFISYIFGVIFSILGDISIVFLIIGRILNIFSSITFYGGFVLPKWMKQLFF